MKKFVKKLLYAVAACVVTFQIHLLYGSVEPLISIMTLGCFILLQPDWAD